VKARESKNGYHLEKVGEKKKRPACGLRSRGGSGKGEKEKKKTLRLATIDSPVTKNEQKEEKRAPPQLPLRAPKPTSWA